MADRLTRNPWYFDTGNNTTPQVAAGKSVYPTAISVRNKSTTGNTTFIAYDASGSVILETYLKTYAAQTFPLGGTGPLKNGLWIKRRALFGVSAATLTCTIYIR